MKWGSGLRWFQWRSLISSKTEIWKLVKKSILDYVKDERTDWWAIRVWSLNPLIDLCYKHWVIKKEDYAFFYTMFNYQHFIKRINPPVFRDPTWSVALTTSDTIWEYLQPSEFTPLNDTHFVYSDAVNMYFILWILEDYIKKNAKDISSALHNSLSWKIKK